MREVYGQEMSRHEPLSPIPELLLEYEDSRMNSPCSEKRRDTGSTEDEGYGSETHPPGIEQMLDGLAEMSRRLSLAPSDLLSIDEALQLPLQLPSAKVPASKPDQPDLSGELESFWRTVRDEILNLRASRDGARADAVLLLDELSKKAGEIDEKDAKIELLKTELAAERKAGKQISEAMEDLLHWVDTNRASSSKASFSREHSSREHSSREHRSSRERSAKASSSRDVTTTTEPRQRKPEHRVLENLDMIPTYGVAFRSTSAEKVIVWKVQVVESYESNGTPIYFHGKHLPKTLKAYVKFLQFWCSDRLPETAKSAICVWCNERGIQTVWHKGAEAKRPCRECSLRGRHCFAVCFGVLRCLPLRDIGGFMKGET
ncbi:hypothetical protein CB0940_02912 [Cercospora beticola]|uniref:Uncharacterized protein n=2 Tax=Cercospora beticola TaxID=122368 RepID=A0A2G5I4C5_CERBT|nr:hypothetical protein CB0940_02912 [Cercospora beticola]PIA99333.1 hypothetical protein CB0940_02912 [Cercospora beticola]CAK1361755.1 unnamed protein product [Cercospora beticola]